MSDVREMEMEGTPALDPTLESPLHISTDLWSCQFSQGHHQSQMFRVVSQTQNCHISMCKNSLLSLCIHRSDVRKPK